MPAIPVSLRTSPSDLLRALRRRASRHRSHLWRQLHIQGWLRGQVPETRFVVISTIRSGSTMLVNLIDAHPAAECFYELFHIHPDAIPFAKKGYV